MKHLIIIAALLIAGCTPETKEISANYVLPKGLEDCQIYEMSAPTARLYVVRCPNSTTSTTTTSGKTTNSVATTQE